MKISQESKAASIYFGIQGKYKYSFPKDSKLVRTRTL